jgi:tetratricopeptide (TPR) repeat protein
MLQKLFSALKGNPKLTAGLIALIAVQAVLQMRIDPLRTDPAVEPPNGSKPSEGIQINGNTAVLPFEYTLGALTGFRTVIAGLLWVRADSFFHSGNYDAILPLLRVITWLDPNWLDVYATGAWHLMYNFTDESNRSDRRYLPNGLALLEEGIVNNPKVYDIYKEKGWNLFDKVKDYDQSALYYGKGIIADPKHDINQMEHIQAHAYERGGHPELAIKVWESAVAAHKKLIDDPKTPEEMKSRSTMGFQSSSKNLRMLKVREWSRKSDIARLGQVDTDLHLKVTRIRPRVLEVSGSWNLMGTIKDAFDDFDFDEKGSLKPGGKGGIVVAGPSDGARMDIRLQDAGYVMPRPNEFSFEIDSNLTIMQDQISVRGGKLTEKGSVYLQSDGGGTDPAAEAAMAFIYRTDQAAVLSGVPIADAIAQNLLTPFGQWQVVTLSMAPRLRAKNKKFYTSEEIPALFAEVKADATKIAAMTTKKLFVATNRLSLPATFGIKKELDMTKDKNMYGFAKDSYDLIISFNPRIAPDPIQDRFGWNGEGMTDKNFLDTQTVPGVRMLRKLLKLTREDVIGEGTKVLYESHPGAAIKK